MKKLLILVIVVTFSSLTSWAQVGIGTPTPNKSSQLEIVAKDKGILIPKVALQNVTDGTTIVNGNVDGLMVYNTEDNSEIIPGFYYWYQDSWKRITTNDDTVDLPENIVIWDVDNNQFTYIDENGNTEIIDLPETITTLVNKGDGTYEYTSEDGTVTLIDVPADVVNNFEEIVNGGPVEIDGTTYNTIKEYITHLIEENETITVLEDKGNGTYEYTSEDGTVTLIDVPADVINNFEEIVNGGPVEIDGTTYNTIKEYITHLVEENETITILEDKGDGTYEYTSEDGTVTLIDVPDDVINNFEEIVNGGPVEIDGTTYNTIKEYITHLVEENETITTLMNNNDGTYTYTSEDDTETTFNVTQSGAGDPNTNGVTGTDGAVYVDESTGDVYTYANGTWNKATGHIKTGEGDPNDNGTPGEKGDIYIDNSTGAVYIYNDQTDEWEVSSDSLTVEEGVVTHTALDGTTVTFDVTQSGIGDPNTTGVTGKDGDVYVDESTGDVYTFANGTWNRVTGHIKTGEGDPNDNGTPGEKGDVYIDNSTGAVYIYNDQTGEWEVSSDSLIAEDGVVTHTALDGTTVTFDVTQSGIGDPNTNSVTGKDGDVYIDESTGDVYTYANGTWNKVTGHIKTGEGDPNDNGTPGEKGDIYIDNSTGAVYIYNDQTDEWEVSSDSLTVEEGVVTHTALDGTVVTFAVTQTGVGDPITNNIAGNEGDIYVDESTGDIYTYANGTWNKVDGGTTITKNTVNYNGDIIDGLPVVVYEGTTHIDPNTAVTDGVDLAGALPSGTNLEGVVTITLYQNGSLITSSTTDVNISGEKIDFNIGIGNMYQVLPEGDYEVIVYATLNE